ncbi:hypothetical protein MBLNU459_g5127t1 [Dothideomycetes sp. NU459]
MPPKDPAKAKPGTGAGVTKAKKEPSTPNKASSTSGLEDSAKSKTKSSTKKRKTGVSLEKLYHALDSFRESDNSALGDTAPVDVSYENETLFSVRTGDGHGQQLRLRAPQEFRLVKSVLLSEGQYAGHQAIIVAPSKPFNFMALPKPIRLQIYHEYLVPTDNSRGIITFCSTGTGVKAKTYYASNISEKKDPEKKDPEKNNKHRLALLGTNKEILAEAYPILYGFTLKFDNSGTLLLFLSGVGERVRSMLTSLVVIQYNQKSALAAFNVLADSKNSIQKLRILDGLGKNQTPEKAAKAFFADARTFLQVVGKAKGNPFAGVELLSYGERCFTVKENNELRPWDEDEIEEFEKALKDKLK